MTEIPTDLNCDIPETIVQILIEYLISEKKWESVLLLLTRNASGQTENGYQGLFERYPLLNIKICSVVNCMQTSMTFRIPLVNLLLDQGVSPHGPEELSEAPIQSCLKKSDFALAYTLLSRGADPRTLSIVGGDTPLHAAMSIALNNEEDGILMLKYLLALYSSEPKNYPYLDPNKQDKDGNTLMHLLFKSDNQKQYQRVMGLLVKFPIKLTLHNNQGKDARHRIKNNDPRLIAWNEAKMKHKRDPSAHPPKNVKAIVGEVSIPKPQAKSTAVKSLVVTAKCDETSFATDRGEQALHEPSTEIAELSKKPLTLKEKLVQAVRDAIKTLDIRLVLPESEATSSNDNVNDCESENGVLQCSSVNETDPVDASGRSQVFPNDLNEDQHAVMIAAEDSDNEQPFLYNNGEEIYNNGDIDLSNTDFSSMTWEIECAPEALKKLGCKSVPHYMKNKILLSILKLGNGEWTRGLRKPLKFSKSDIKLYEVKLDKGARMLWELAIDFSPRCSEDPEKIMESELSHSALKKTGRVYTEIIRIWDIVLDHCKLNHAIENICSSYNRGLACVLRKKLKRITKTQVYSNVEKRIPKCFVENVDLENNNDRLFPDYFPPASAAETEYNIMKFHSFSTDMAHNILNNLSARVEYPFRVGELEYAVIDLNPQPMEAIILIGRSGTGKTTCCMYRLWKKFHSYWERVEVIGEPWMVKQTWQRRKYDDGFDSEDTEDEDLTETSESNDEEQIAPEHADEEVCSQSSEEEVEEESETLEHYHPVFITKSHVLCQEVQRNFNELSKSTKATSHFKPVEPNVFKLQNLQDENFPVFLTSQQFLLLLDASMPDPYFPRNDDGSLQYYINGWSTADELDIPDLLREDDEGDPDLDNEAEENACELKESYPRVFVTFEVFANDLWPKMVKGKSPFNAALVWKEIKSFLKGSFEALKCHQGRLTEEQYFKLGKKRAPNFQGDRKEIYKLFILYERIKSSEGYFDEEDLLYNLSCRVSRLEELPWSIHELYGDEIQDFTQAELILLMRCINDPNSMFLTGDTAQSIMKGVSFRFSDLRSLFYYASKNCADEEKKCIVRKPKRIYQLYQNYRSHSGILCLASGVVDLLQCYFPESFDRLPRDCGLFDGPRPTVLDSCSISDLAILLRGNKRKTQPIEFGAHQVILVKNELSKEQMPEELNLALVLTIYEAKGLEFDDVLLYNFFTDSEAPKEWKIITSFNPVSHENHKRRETDKTAVIEMPLDQLSAPPSRPPQMNPELYKILNGELKQLYTAITRARVNLWIFDENQEKRAPAFEYFIKSNFVKVVKTDENTDLDDKIFVRTSSKEEWISRGDYYAKHKYWNVAAKCYQKGGATDKEKLAFTHDAVLHLQSKKTSARDKMEYIKLATRYLECGEYKLALKCLTWAKEYRLCAELCNKLEKVKEAGYFYKRIKDHKIAAQCFEESGEFELALNLYLEEKLYEEAANVVQRYKMINPEGHLSHTAKQLYLEAAADYFNNNRIKKMTEVLSKLDIEDQLLFLKTRKLWGEAAELLKSRGRCEEAAILMRQHGKLLEAANLSKKEEFRASCLLAAARCMIAEDEDVGSILSEAKKIFSQQVNLVGVAEASLLQGIVESKFELLHTSYNIFLRLAHNAGTVEALFHSVKCGENEKSLLFMASRGINALVTLLKALGDSKNNSEKDMVKSCLEFFGIARTDGAECFIHQNEGARILTLFTDSNFDSKEKTKDGMYCMDFHKMKLVLEKHLLERLCEISSDLFARVYRDICPKFIAGLDCTYENCTDFHQPLQRFELKGILYDKVNLLTISGLLLESKNHTKEFNSEIQNILDTYAFKFCNNLLQLFFPKHFHLRIVSENITVCKIFEEILQNSPLSFKTMLNKYVESLFQQLDNRNRRESTDHWLQVAQIFTLCSNYPSSLESVIAQEERKYNREFLLLGMKVNDPRAEGKRVKLLEGRYAMLQSDNARESLSSTHIHFFRLLDGALRQLYVSKKPDDWKWYFYRFMNVLVKKCIEPLIPNIGNTVMLLEWQFVLCSAVLMRFEAHTRVILPKSYISILHHWDFMFGRKLNKGLFKDTYSILWDFRPKDVPQTTRNFRHHISYLAAVLCGGEKKEFNVLLDAFNDIDYISSGEAERSVVLCLVMMVNVVVFSKEEDILWQHFSAIQNKLKQMKENFPSRVSKRLIDVVDKVAIAESIEELVNVLQDLLDQRDNERLVECSWRWDSNYSRNQVRGIYFEDKFSFKKFDRVQHIASACEHSNVDEDFKYSHADNDSQDKVDLVADLASKVQQKHSVMQKFDELLLLVCYCIKWKRAYRRMKNKRFEETIPDMFKKANVDRTQCDLCGVKFSHGPLFPALTEDPEECSTEDVATNVTDVEVNEDLSKDIQLIENYETHITTEEHQCQSTAYINYLQFYKDNVDLVVCEGKSLIHTVEQTMSDHQTSREEFHIEQKKIESKIKVIVDLVDEIYEKKSWTDAEALMKKPVENLKSITLAVKILMEKTEKQMTKAEGVEDSSPICGYTDGEAGRYK
uniref:Tetratricopeptide repeat and ankyrin repeat containing 1 n=1 Tax=Leptobrachium leishanense TaxID=445787 RepID=A0A8C5PKW3_9ANUR